MKQKNLRKTAWLLLLLLLLIAVMVTPAAAQEPEGEEGDVNIQVGFFNLLWNPPGGINVPVGGASSITRVNIIGAFEATAFVLEIGYDAAVVKPDFANIKPGSLLRGVQGVDYFWKPDLISPPVCAAGGIKAGLRITVAYFNSDAGLIEGSGPLVEIPWKAAGGAGPSTLCVDPANSKLVDQQGVAVPFPAIAEPVNIVAAGDRFRIGLQGGKGSNLDPGPGSAPFQIPAANVTNVMVNGGFCTLIPVPPPPGNGECSPLFGPPYSVTVSRPGYLNVSVSFATSADVRSIYMLAGDLNGDNQINILDLAQMAGLLGSTYISNGSQNPIVERADFTGPGFVIDRVINIADLVLVARNYGRSGPTDGTGSEF